MSKEIPYKIYLEESEMPKQWYNVRADMKKKPAVESGNQTASYRRRVGSCFLQGTRKAGIR